MTNCITVNAPKRAVITALCRDRSVSITAAQQGPPGRDGGFAALACESLDPISSSWTLAKTPANPDKSAFYLNGQKVRFATDYVINGPIVTWQGVGLVDSDYLEINYT